MCSLPTPKQLFKASADPFGIVTKEPFPVDPLGIFVKTPTAVPQVEQDKPLADQSKIEAQAAATGVQARTEMRRRRRRSSLLATGPQGDKSPLPSTIPGAAPGKPTLGA